MANQLLSAWLFIIGIEMIAVLINEMVIELYPIKIIPFVYGPLLYLYARWMTDEAPRFDPRYLWHFTPFGIFLVTYLIFIGEPVMHGTDGFLVIDRFVPYRIVYASAFLISITAYSIATFVVIGKHQKRMKELLSYSSGKFTLKWLMALSITFYAGYVLMFIFGGIDIMTGFMPFDPYELSFISLTLLTYLFGIFGFSQRGIFGEVLKKEVSDIEPSAEKQEKAPVKYSRSGLKKKDIGGYISRIEEHMLKGKPYLDGEMSIYDLSEQLDISRHILSEVINEHMGMNFYQMINDYRVEEVKQRIENGEHKNLTLLAIAFDSGFNSKSTFNTIFKQQTGQTPTEYIKSL